MIDDERTERAEHTVMMAAEYKPSALMQIFHDHATESDLDAMDEALVQHIKSLKEDENSPFFEALVKIIKDKEVSYEDMQNND